MKFTKTQIEGVYLIDLQPHGDERGFFARMFCKDEFARHGLNTDFVQANTSFSATKGTLRGMHYQHYPHAEAKLVKCIQGALYDVVLDLREDSDTFGQHQAFELTAENRSMVYIPEGCAHGFMTLEKNTEIMYLVSAFYAPDAESGVRFDDAQFNIPWPMKPGEMSAKDKNYPYYQDALPKS